MELNIKRFASVGDNELYPDYKYDYTPNGYIRTAMVTIVCEYDISSIFLVQGGDEVNDTANWIITEDFYGRPCAKRYFHEPVDATYNIYCENNETPFSVNVYIANDFQPESEQYPLEINGDIKIAKTTMKLKDVVNSIHNIADIIYPVGSVYISINSTNPSKYFGGTWTAFATGRTLVGVDTNQTEFNTVEKTGGEKTHKLTINEIPSHTHTTNRNDDKKHLDNGGSDWYSQGISLTQSVNTGATGGDQAHNNLQPYITVYMWRRTA